MITTHHAVLGACALAIASLAHAAPVTIDFETDALGAPLVAGTIIDDEYAAAGVTIRAENHTATHPDLAVIFDSANPTGGDNDLATPGTGPNNTVALNNILIIAERGADRGDGIIDAAPDDEGNRPAGYIDFDLDFIATGASIVLIDIEETGGTIDFRTITEGLVTINIPATGNNSVQTIAYDDAAFTGFRVNLAGSGAVGGLDIVPTPASLALLSLAGLTAARRRRIA